MGETAERGTQPPMKYDATIKELLQSSPPAFLRTLVGAQPVEILTVEFPKVQTRRPDFVARLTDGRIYHLEIQSDNDPEMAWRMLGYYPLIRRLYGQPLVQQALYVGDQTLTMPSGLEEPSLSFRYDLIDIRQLDGGPLLASPSVADNMLALLCRAGDPERDVRQIFRRMNRLPAKIRRDRLTQLLILSQLRSLTELILKEAKAMTDLTEVFRRSPIVQEFVKKEAQKEARREVKEAQKEAQKEARREVKEARREVKEAQKEARREVQKEVQREVRDEAGRLLTLLLEGRFGKLPKWAKQKIAAADTATLEDWAGRLLKAESLREALQ